jgi:hypothetical protein
MEIFKVVGNLFSLLPGCKNCRKAVFLLGHQAAHVCFFICSAPMIIAHGILYLTPFNCIGGKILLMQNT